MIYRPDHTQKPEANRRGFALLIVLSFLIILVMLFATVSNRALANASFYTTEKRLLQQQFENAALADVLSQMNLNAMTATGNLIASPLQDDITLVLQNVGGLVDLNTAAPELIAAVIGYLELSAEAINDYQTWRQEGRRLLRVSDFLRIVGGDPAQAYVLEAVATVHSGKRYLTNTLVAAEIDQMVAGLNGVVVDQSPSENFVVGKELTDSNIFTIQSTNNYIHTVK